MPFLFGLLCQGLAPLWHVNYTHSLRVYRVRVVGYTCMLHTSVTCVHNENPLDGSVFFVLCLGYHFRRLFLMLASHVGRTCHLHTPYSSPAFVAGVRFILYFWATDPRAPLTYPLPASVTRVHCTHRMDLPVACVGCMWHPLRAFVILTLLQLE